MDHIAPRKKWNSKLDLSEDNEASVSVENLARLSPRKLALVIKTFTHYKIPLDMSDSRMGKLFSKLGTKNR